MKVVLDSNVIIAALATRGLCAELLEVCLAHGEIVLSHYLLSEVERNLTHKIGLPSSITQEILEFLKKHAQIVEPEKLEVSGLKDQTDLPIIGTAVAGGAQFLITGDQELLKLRKFGQVENLSPRDFWKRLKDQTCLFSA